MCMKRQQRACAFKRTGILFVTASVLTSFWTPCVAQSLRWLGTLGGNYSRAHDVSDDGSVVVGESEWLNRTRAFRWTLSGGMQNLGSFRDDSLPGGSSVAYGISPDGALVVGYSDTNSGFANAFAWPGRNNSLINLGTLGGDNSVAYDIAISSNSRQAFAVGSAQNNRGQQRAFRIEASRQNTSMQDLGTLGGTSSEVYAITPDGNTVVGTSETLDGTYRAFRWIASTNQMQDLGVPRGCINSIAYGVSSNGRVIVGTAITQDSVRRPFFWNNGGVELLPTPNDAAGEAYGVNEDGSVIVGWSSYANDIKRAFRWSRERWEDLNQVYSALLTDGSILQVARAVSSDGRYIVGHGYNANTGRVEAFLLDAGDQGGCSPSNGDTDGNGCVDDADLLQVLFAFGQTGSNLGSIDTNCDETVDDADLLTVLFNFGTGC